MCPPPRLAILALLAILASGRTSNELFRHYDGFKLFRATPTSLGQLNALQNLSKMAEMRAEGEEGIEFWKFNRQLRVPADIFVAGSEEPRLRKFLEEHRIAHQTVVEDFGIQMREAGETSRFDGREEFIARAEEFDLGRYHRYEAIVQFLQSLAQSNGQFASFGSIGKTFEGRDLAIIKLGYPSLDSRAKPVLLMDAGIHAREWIAPAVALHAINAFMNEQKWHALLRQVDVHVIPVMNPDGYVHSWDKDRLWRRTRSGPYSTSGLCRRRDFLLNWNWAFQGDGSTCFGADPNRNFPFHWAEAGTEACPCSEVYPGPAPLSEVECANLAEYMRANQPRIKAYLSLHSYGNLLIHGWNYAEHSYPQEVADIKLVAQQMANAVQLAGGPRFTVGSGPDILYEAAGGSDDYASSLGIKYSYTMELTNGQFGRFFGGFIYPEKGINAEANKVLAGIFVLAAKVAQISNSA